MKSILSTVDKILTKVNHLEVDNELKRMKQTYFQPDSVETEEEKAASFMIKCYKCDKIPFHQQCCAECKRVVCLSCAEELKALGNFCASKKCFNNQVPLQLVSAEQNLKNNGLIEELIETHFC